MTRTLAWVVAVVLLGSALVAGAILSDAHGQTPPPSGSSTPATTNAGPTYIPVTAETLGISSTAQGLLGSYVKLADFFYDEVASFPDAAAQAGFNPRDYYAFRTRPDGSDLLCFVPRHSPKDNPKVNPDLESFLKAKPVRGTEIFLMGQVGPRVFTGDGGATVVRVDRIVLGHDEPRASKSDQKKPVTMTIERIGPRGNLEKQEFTIETPRKKYIIPDPADPDNKAKNIYISLDF